MKSIFISIFASWRAQSLPNDPANLAGCLLQRTPVSAQQLTGYRKLHMHPVDAGVIKVRSTGGAVRPTRATKLSHPLPDDNSRHLH
jgi:hypothetical protein